MKKNRIFILGIVTMFVAILSLTLVSGTLARYTSTGYGVGNFEVAKWDVKINGEQLESIHEEVEFSLFDLNANYDNDETIGSYPAVENGEDIAKGKIAPGSWGSFSYKLKNDSEVTATYAVDYSVNEAGVPLEWSIDDGNTWTTDLANITATELEIGSGEVEIKVYWRWIFNGNDTDDTNLGLDPENHKPTITINVTFTQVD